MIQQFDLFAAAESAGPLFMALAATPPFTKQIHGPAAHTLLADLNAMTDAAFDLSRVKGRDSEKRALEIAMTGGHTLELRGPVDADSGGADLAFASYHMREKHRIGSGYSVTTTETPNAVAHDLTVAFDELSEADRTCPAPTETSATVAARILAAQAFLATMRYLPERDPRAEALMQQAVTALDMSEERADAVWHVARTIAAMAECKTIGRIHLAEALSYLPPREW